MTRNSIVLCLLLAACGDDGGSGVPDASLPDGTGVDALVDALVDAVPVEASPEVTAACTNVCTKLAACFGDDEELDVCISECSVDLADCTSTQVEQVDACRDAECGANGATIGACISAVGCVEMEGEPEPDPPAP